MRSISAILRLRGLERLRLGVLGRVLAPALLTAGAAVFVGCKPTGAAPTGKAQAESSTQVVAVEVKRQPIHESLSSVGSLAANEMVGLRPQIDGIIEEVLFEEGTQVKKGALLLRLDDAKLKSGLAEAEASFKMSQLTFERNKQLLQDNLISKQEFDQAASFFEVRQASLDLMRRNLEDTEIRAPFDGVVGARSVSPGQVITPATILTWLVDLDPVKVELDLPEKFLSELRVGQPLEFKVSAYPGEVFRGDVYFVAAFVDPAARTALVKAQIPNKDGRLKPGMFANVDLTLQTRPNSLVIPEAAISQILDANRAMTYVVSSTNTAVLRPLTLGLRLAGMVEVTEGLQAGERVIVEGFQKIGPGSRVRLAPVEAEAPYLQPQKRGEPGGG